MRQPINFVKWIKREKLKANNYNPNRVAPTELRLLKISILADGWTQPIVARRDGEIVDGFHRWMVSADKEIVALTEGKVPVVFLRKNLSMKEQMFSTVRHNRARGSHAVVKMVELIRRLLDKHDVTDEELAEVLTMEPEEVSRLYDSDGVPERQGGTEFGKGWEPDNKS